MWEPEEDFSVEYGLIFKVWNGFSRFSTGRIFTFFCIFQVAFACAEAKQPAQKVKNLVAPYLLPDNHPIKPTLDAIFSASRVTFTIKTLVEAGFAKTKPRAFTRLVVTKHPAMPGYIFKLYLDAQRMHKEIPEYQFWKMRIQGAEKVRKAITNRGLDALFKVPHKWIYQLPDNHFPQTGYYAKHYILVEEDMDLVSDKENKAIWKSSLITFALLDDIYAILKAVGLSDCAKPDNIPFSIDGKIAFIDTQTHGNKQVNYGKLTPFLSEANQAYWKSLTRE